MTFVSPSVEWHSRPSLWTVKCLSCWHHHSVCNIQKLCHKIDVHLIRHKLKILGSISPTNGLQSNTWPCFGLHIEQLITINSRISRSHPWNAPWRYLWKVLAKHEQDAIRGCVESNCHKLVAHLLWCPTVSWLSKRGGSPRNFYVIR